MKILLTGNQGYIGSVMEDYFLKEGHEVVGFDSGYFKGRHFIPLDKKVIDNRKKNQIIKDIRDVGPNDLRGIEAVVHLAALSNDPLGDLDPKLTEEINYKSTINLAKISKEQNVSRFIYSSSCSLYGASGTDKPLDEKSKFNPVTPYAVSKVESEKGLLGLLDKNFSTTFMRNSTVYGVSPKMRFDLVLNNLSGHAYTAGEVRMKSDGKPWRPLVHVQDLCLAFSLALKADKEKVNGEAFNVGINSENFTIKQIAEKVINGFEDSKFICLNESTGDSRSYRVNFDKIEKILGFKGKWNVEKGVEELKDAFGKVNLDKEIFENEYFTTLKRMKNLITRGEINSNLRY